MFVVKLLGKLLDFVMWIGAPFAFLVSWALHAAGADVSRAVAGTLCAIFGVCTLAALAFFVIITW
jgi:hypothetical protein